MMHDHETPTAVTIKGIEKSGSETGCKHTIRVGIDKIKVRMDFASCTVPEYLQVQEWARSVRQMHFGKKGKVWSKPGRSQTNVFQELEGGGSLFVLFGKHLGEFRAWFEFNPNNVAMWELEGHLTMMLEKGFYSLLERGVVTYCEFAIDVPNAQIEQFVFISRTHRQQDLRWINRGGLYVGSRNLGELYFHIYDKQRQLRDVKGQEVGCPLLRIEARIKGKRRFPFKDVLQLASPFSCLLVLEVGRIIKLHDEGLLGDVFQLQGAPHEIQYQLASLTGTNKKCVVERLSAFEVAWWDPVMLWESLEPSLAWVLEGVTYSGWV